MKDSLEDRLVDAVANSDLARRLPISGAPFLELCDEKGLTRAGLGLTEDGGAGLGLYDEAGRSRAGLGLTEAGLASLSFLDAEGQARARLGMADQEIPELRLHDAEGRLRGALRVRPDGMSLLELCDRVAPSDATVLLMGETGTGKELTARYIHNASKRRAETFVAINCAALPDTLLESELFGHEKGSFTGAHARRQGWFELADGGTLLLDEIGDITRSTQAKLLRVLQEKEFVRVGGT